MMRLCTRTMGIKKLGQILTMLGKENGQEIDGIIQNGRHEVKSLI